MEYDTKCETVTDCNGVQQDENNGGANSGGALDFYGVPPPSVSTEYLLAHRKCPNIFPGSLCWSTKLWANWACTEVKNLGTLQIGSVPSYRLSGCAPSSVQITSESPKRIVATVYSIYCSYYPFR